MRKHIENIHEKKEPTHECEICGKMFGNIHRLAIHIKGVHEKQRPFKCANCDKSFFVKSSLKAHVEQVHEGKKRVRPKMAKVESTEIFKCLQCDKQFQTKPGLNTHIDIVHIHMGKKRFECTDCDSRLA